MKKLEIIYYQEKMSDQEFIDWDAKKRNMSMVTGHIISSDEYDKNTPMFQKKNIKKTFEQVVREKIKELQTEEKGVVALIFKQVFNGKKHYKAVFYQEN